MSKEDFVTIYTDASLIWKKGEAFWAFHAKCCKGRYQDRGEADRTIWDSNIAEMYAICIAVWKCLKKWPHVSGFFVNTDSKVCCKIWWDWENSPNIPEAIEMKNNLKKSLGDRWIKVKWVKGHQEKDDARAYLNNKVDRMAKKLNERRREEDS